MRYAIILLFCFSITATDFYANTNTIPYELSQNYDSLIGQGDEEEKNFLHEQELLNFFLKPITFSPEGISHFFKYMYNHPMYADFVAHDFSHLIQLLEFGKETHKATAYAKSVLQIFSQKIKMAPYVNAYNFYALIEHLPNYLQPYFYQEKTNASVLEKLQTQLKEYFSSMFASYFSLFKKDPDAFLNTLAQQAAKINGDSAVSYEVDHEQLRKDAVRFLEINIAKLMWDMHNTEEAWVTLHGIAQSCFELFNKKIISAEDYNDISWSLITRFCYLLRLEKERVAPASLQNLQEQLAIQEYVLFVSQEVEDAIETKKEYVKRTLLEILQFHKSLITKTPGQPANHTFLQR